MAAASSVVIEAAPASTSERRIAAFSSLRRVVVKVGTRVLTHDDGRLALSRLYAVIEGVAALRAQGIEVLLVSSGAVGLGREALGLDATPTDLALRQACAAVGQGRLMGLYQEGFTRLGVVSAQVLLTEADLDDRLRYLNLRSALLALLRQGAVPIINENDVVSTDELAFLSGGERPVFGDNDRLSALVATKLHADLLLLLTDVDGVYDRSPRQHPGARLLDEVGSEDQLTGVEGTDNDSGRGGMRSKVQAASIAARSGCHVVIASGRQDDAVRRLVRGEAIGTWFPARGELGARRRWIAFATAARGTLRLDAGAVRALQERGASLLAAGVFAVEGDFRRGDVVELRGPDDALVGRGIVHCDREAAEAWRRGNAPVGARNHHALVHRDHLVLRGAGEPRERG